MKWRFLIIDQDDNVLGTNDPDVADAVEDALVLDAELGRHVGSRMAIGEYWPPEDDEPLDEADQ